MCVRGGSEEGRNNYMNYEKTWELAGYAGALLFIFGYYLNSNALGYHWGVWVIGNCLVGAYSIHKRARSTAVMSFVIAAFCLLGLIKN